MIFALRLQKKGKKAKKIFNYTNFLCLDVTKCRTKVSQKFLAPFELRIYI